MQLRSFESADFGKTLSFYNLYGKARPVSEREWKRLVLLDPNFDPEWFIIAEDADGIAGMLYLVRRLVPIDTFGEYEKEKVWINAFAVKKELVPTLGRLLIEEAEKLAADAGASVVTATSYTPNYFTQGIDAEYSPEYLGLFSECGYAEIEESNSMALDLSSFQRSESAENAKKRLAREGITVMPLDNSHIWALFEYLRRYSKPGWTCRVRKLLLDTEDLSRVHIACEGDRVVGFNMYGDADTSIMRFGPYSVADDYRGRGIGRVLLEECLMKMKEKGLPEAWLQWASGDVAPALYEKTGFRKTGRFVTFRKQL